MQDEQTKMIVFIVIDILIFVVVIGGCVRQYIRDRKRYFVNDRFKGR